MWKYLLAIVALQFVVAFVSYAIVRVGSDRDVEEEEGSSDIANAQPGTAPRIA